jgi:ubiquinone/menaquinone biosynthesis C-methylase UbiE/chorismate mutase
MIRSLDLQELGQRIDQVDELLFAVIARRTGLSLNVGAYKRAVDPPLPIFRKDVELGRLANARRLAGELGIDPDFAELVLYMIIGESCKRQMIQLQGRVDTLPDPQNEDDWYRILRDNLLRLTERIAPCYDEEYGGEHVASKLYREFERRMIVREVDRLSARGQMVDLGCATGFRTFLLESEFETLIGYDVSEHMIDQANCKIKPEDAQRISFSQADLEEGIPLPDNSVSFVLMNLGTASDMRDIGRVILEAERVLVPDGRFMFSFYNREAFVYHWFSLPWPVSLAAEVNHKRQCLDVHVGTEIYSVYARAYTLAEVVDLFPRGMELQEKLTYPTVSPILPNCLLQTQEAWESVEQLDLGLAGGDGGAYILVAGRKVS